MAIISEDDIEQASLQKLKQYGFTLLNCYLAMGGQLGSPRAHAQNVRCVDGAQQVSGPTISVGLNLLQED